MQAQRGRLHPVRHQATTCRLHASLAEGARHRAEGNQHGPQARSYERLGTFPTAIESRMSWQPVHIRTPRTADPVLQLITDRLESLAQAAVKSRGWPMVLTPSEEDVFIAVYAEGRGFYHRHRDVLPYFSSEIPRRRKHAAQQDGDLAEALASTSVGDLVKSMMDDSLYPQAHRRVISVVVQLAEGNGTEYEGGSLNVLTGSLNEPGLALPHVNAVRRGARVITAPACPGDVIIHPAFSAHEVTPVTRGLRESLTWWIPGNVDTTKDEL
uniref:Fe2OG dioxygenase domain-containing protein n=1 Tax=Haptolina ericina TaxID=156174 RepID=A0A7S3EYI5_9EUKA